jgi:hypothetical protein
MASLESARASVRASAMLVGGLMTGDQVLDAVQARAAEYNRKCPAYEAMREEEARVSVAPNSASCLLGIRDANGKLQEGTLDAYKRARTTCSEIVEADFERLKVQAEQCEARGPDSNLPLVNLEANQAKAKLLEASLLRYLSSCAPDPKLTSELSRLGLDALMQDGKAARDEWLASRASAGTR